MNVHRAARRTAAATVLLLLVGAGSANASSGPGEAVQARQPDRRCARQFDRAARAYVTTTQHRDARGFNALLDPDVTIVLANGGVVSGKKDSADFIRDFFADPGWTQTFTELDRHVAGCRTAFVLYDSVYSVPAQNRVSPLVIGVTYTYRHGRWLVLHNQDSTGPAS